MTLRDVHNRCVTCGRTPTEKCCEKCHEADLYAFLEQEIETWIDEMNTEAVNQ